MFCLLPHALRLHGSTVARYISSNTVLVVASAPGFPHGIVDDVAGIAAAAAKRGVLCHVDGCLGGYLLPFVERLGYDVPVFDFRVPGEFECWQVVASWHQRHCSRLHASLVLLHVRRLCWQGAQVCCLIGFCPAETAYECCCCVLMLQVSRP